MHGYDENKLTDIETIKDKSYPPRNAILTKAQKIFLDTKKDSRKEIKSFFPTKFKEYLPKDQQGVLLNAMRLYNYRNKITRLFENRNIKSSMHVLDAKSETEEYDEAKKSEQKFDKSIGERVQSRRQRLHELNKMITKNDKIINKELFKNCFQFQKLSDMKEELFKIQNAHKNKELVQEIQSGLINLNKKIKKMSKDEIRNEKPYEIVDAVAEILEFNRQNQEGQGLKTLTAEQMLSRLPISLAQLKAGNNSEKLKNEIRSYCILCTDEKLSKTIYEHLINAI